MPEMYETPIQAQTGVSQWWSRRHACADALGLCPLCENTHIDMVAHTVTSINNHMPACKVSSSHLNPLLTFFLAHTHLSFTSQPRYPLLQEAFPDIPQAELGISSGLSQSLVPLDTSPDPSACASSTVW